MARPTLKEAQARYVHRFTMDHVPEWAREKRSDGTYYAPQYRSDKEWYDNSLFPGDKDYPFKGWMDGSCCSRNETWPLGQSLDKPFNIRSKA